MTHNPLKLTMPFDEALKRFARVKPGDVGMPDSAIVPKLPVGKANTISIDLDELALAVKKGVQLVQNGQCRSVPVFTIRPKDIAAFRARK